MKCQECKYAYFREPVLVANGTIRKTPILCELHNLGVEETDSCTSGVMRGGE